jgi:hypothetical protein
MIFQQKVVDITTSALLYIESSIHEAFTLSLALLLAPQQHSPFMNDIFTKSSLDALTNSLVHESLELELDVNDGTCGQVFRIKMKPICNYYNFADMWMNIALACSTILPK